MKKSRYTEEQVAYALRLTESGTPVADVCRQIGIAEATFYLWKKKYGSLGVAEVRALRQMREENARLKRLVADLTLDRQILQEVIRKRLKPARRRELAQWIHDNKKRVHRLYRLEGLQVRLRTRRKKRLSLHRGAVPPARGRNQHWSMDFVHDQLVSGRTFRVLTVIDQWRRESVTTAPSSRPRRSTSGRTDGASSWTSSGQASPWRTRLSRVATAVYGTNVSTCTASNRSPTPRI